MQKNIAIIIPSYNASAAILQTIRSIKDILPHALIIIVDDNSPDKTAEIIQRKYKNDKNIFVMIRNTKAGRGSAVIAGMKQAFANKDIDYFIEMDADFCHNPKYIPKMIEKCDKSGMVIASKYLATSSIKGLNFKRKTMSRLLNFAARIILQVPVSDYSNGFRCYSREVVLYITKQKFHAKGFILLSEILYLVHKKGYSIKEIPFDFKTDNLTPSNLNKKEIVEALLTLLSLRFSK